MPDRKTYNKLVRDRIPEIIKSRGADCEVETLDETAYRRELLHKLVEEAAEAVEAGDSDHLLTELGDVCEVARALLELNGHDWSALEDRRLQRRAERGGFQDRLYLSWTEEMPIPEPVSVACAIIERDALFLVAKRSAVMPLPLKWEFPGGKVERDERPEDALMREIREELAIDVEIQSSLPASIGSGANGVPIRLLPFTCGLASGDPHPHEHSEIRWVDAESALQLDWAEADIPVLEVYLANRRRTP